MKKKKTGRGGKKGREGGEKEEGVRLVGRLPPGAVKGWTPLLTFDLISVKTKIRTGVRPLRTNETSHMKLLFYRK